MSITIPRGGIALFTVLFPICLSLSLRTFPHLRASALAFPPILATLLLVALEAYASPLFFVIISPLNLLFLFYLHFILFFKNFSINLLLLQYGITEKYLKGKKLQNCFLSVLQYGITKRYLKGYHTNPRYNFQFCSSVKDLF